MLHSGRREIIDLFGGHAGLDLSWTDPGNAGAGIQRYQAELVTDSTKNCGVVASSAHSCSITGLMNGRRPGELLQIAHLGRGRHQPRRIAL